MFKLFAADGSLQAEALGGTTLRKWVQARTISEVRLYHRPDGRGGFKFVFAGGETITGEYASFNLLGAQVRLWAKLRDAPLFIDDFPYGRVRPANQSLPKYPKLQVKRSG